MFSRARSIHWGLASGQCQRRRCQELRRLAIWHFQPRSADLSDLSNLVRLEQLSITQTNIPSLAGLETLEDLRYCNLAYAPQLTSLEAFAAPGCSIRELSLSKVKGIQAYEPIAAISQLRRLMLFGCAAMANLKWMKGMRDLDFFSFVDTNLVDGDLSPLLELPKLRYVGTLDKRHYSCKCDDLNAKLQARGS